MPSISEIFVILGYYKYWIIFPVVIFEGPIIIIITGFLVSLGVLNPYLAFSVLIVGDLIGDSMYYSIGRYWRDSSFIKKYGRLIGYDLDKAVFLEDHFKRHLWKTLLVAKFAQGIGSTIQISSGIAKVSYPKFLWINIIGVIPKTIILMLLGFYIGDSYEKINQYIHSIAFTFVTLAIIVFLYFTISRVIKSYFTKETPDL
jgi:membrane-associated protein